MSLASQPGSGRQMPAITPGAGHARDITLMPAGARAVLACPAPGHRQARRLPARHRKPLRPARPHRRPQRDRRLPHRAAQEAELHVTPPRRRAPVTF